MMRIEDRQLCNRLNEAGTTEISVGDTFKLGMDDDLTYIVTAKNKRTDFAGTAIQHTLHEDRDRSWLTINVDFGKDGWKPTPNAADKLNSLDCEAEIVNGRIESLTREGRELTDEEYEYVGLDPEDDHHGCLDEHPEGADRGGYVPALGNGAYFSDLDGWRY